MKTFGLNLRLQKDEKNTQRDEQITGCGNDYYYFAFLLLKFMFITFTLFEVVEIWLRVKASQNHFNA